MLSHNPPHLLPADIITLSPDTLTTVTKMAEITFTVDLNGQSQSNFAPSHNVLHCSTVFKAFNTDLTDQTCLIFTSTERTQMLLQYYNSLKQQAPKLLKGVCLIPASHLDRLRPDLTGWQHTHTLTANTFTIQKHWERYPTATEVCTKTLYLFTDTAPNTTPTDTTVYEFTKGEPTMTFDGKISGARATIGADTFASGTGYIHPTFVEQNRLTTRPCKAQVILGDGSTAVDCDQECFVHLKLGAYDCRCWLLILPIPEPYDVLLGDEWLKTFHADMLYS
jgi:hypothetical protein